MIENFFGFPDGIGGAELARRAGRQAEKFGAEVMVMHGALGSHLNDPDEQVDIVVEGGIEITASVVLAATGMDWRRLDIPGLDELLGRGVYYGAGRSEAAPVWRRSRGRGWRRELGRAGRARPRRRGRAGDDARPRRPAREDVVRLPGTAHRGEPADRRPAEDRADGGAQRKPLTASWPSASGTSTRHSATALFICIGGVPHTNWCPREGVLIDSAGYILTGDDLGSRPEG
jgi:thioredoxin reductase (NADPH)